MANHLLGKEVINDSQKLLNADVTNNGTVSAADLVFMRSVLNEINGYILPN